MTATATISTANDIVRDAFARMAGWANDLPGWCDHADPFARALQAAFGIRLAPEKIAEEDAFIAKAIREVLVDYDYYEDTGRRVRYLPRLAVTTDVVDAACRVVQHVNIIMLKEVARKRRWRAMIGDAYLADWTIVKRVLVGHQSFREMAEDLGLDKSGNGLGRRFREAIKAIADAVGPVQWPSPALSPQQNPYFRGPLPRTGQRPNWRHKLHVHGARPDLRPELELVDQFIASGGTIQKLPSGLAVDFQGEVIGKHCTCYGPDGEVLWTVSKRPQPAWDNVEGGARYPDADLVGMPPWESKMHTAFAVKWQRGLQWLELWQSKKTERFAVTFYNAGEDKLLPGKKNGGRRDCTGPEWQYQGIRVRDARPAAPA